MPRSTTPCQAALAVLIVLKVTMLAALFTATPPHPPLAVAPFALGPFLGAAVALAAAAFLMEAAGSPARTALSALAGGLALISFGPQKWLDPAIGQIWPAVLLGEGAVGVIAWSLWTRWRRGANRPPRAA